MAFVDDPALLFAPSKSERTVQTLHLMEIARATKSTPWTSVRGSWFAGPPIAKSSMAAILMLFLLLTTHADFASKKPVATATYAQQCQMENISAVLNAITGRMLNSWIYMKTMTVWV